MRSTVTMITCAIYHNRTTVELHHFILQVRGKLAQFKRLTLIRPFFSFHKTREKGAEEREAYQKGWGGGGLEKTDQKRIGLNI